MIAVLLVPALSPARAEILSLRLEPPLCHAVVPVTTDPASVPASAFRCGGRPHDYARRSLVLLLDPRRIAIDADDVVVMLHQTRFDRMSVIFRYADGFVDRREARRGDYSYHWRLGGQLLFAAAPHRGGVREIRLAFDHLASDRLIRLRLETRLDANRDIAFITTVTGIALALLLIGAIYTLVLAAATQRRFLAWQGVWAVLVLAWGIVWSQAALIFLPEIAGTEASRICTILSCCAMTAATLSVVAATADHVPRRIGRGATLLGLLVPIVGIVTSHVSDSLFSSLSTALSVLALGDVCVAALLLGWARRAGSPEARELIWAWAAPMLTFILASIVDLGAHLMGGGAQIAVLFACACQTIVLSFAATRRVSRLRIDLNAARAAEDALAELARRDPLTGLLNRRGFVERVNETFAGGNPSSFGLLLIDVDKFKSINDRFGHETGDEVLCRIAARLRRLERDLCITGRLGGEEFVVGVSGLTSFMLEQFAETIRRDLAACDHGAVTRQRDVTVSIGVAEGSTVTPFQKLYGAADRALYDAKHAGRNMVVFHATAGALSGRALLERDQRSFGW